MSNIDEGHHSAPFAHDGLDVYDEGIQFAEQIRKTVQEWKDGYFLKNQIVRASESITTNLAEGARLTKPQGKLLRLDYKTAIAFVRWFHELRDRPSMETRHCRLIDESSVSVVLNIAEGNGRYSHLERNRFFGISQAAALKSAATLDLAENGLSDMQKLSIGKGTKLLHRVSQMLNRMQ